MDFALEEAQPGNIPLSAYADNWEQQRLSKSPGAGSYLPGSLVFALLICDSWGELWLNGYDDTYATQEPAFVPVIESVRS